MLRVFYSIAKKIIYPKCPQNSLCSVNRATPRPMTITYRSRKMKATLWILLLLATLGNIAGFLFIKSLYTEANRLRLDPLQLGVYTDKIPKKSTAKPRVVFFGDSRSLSWPAPETTDYEFINRGIGQQTSEQIRLRYEQHVRPLQADILVLQLCVNDLKTIPLFDDSYTQIISRCQHNLEEIIRQGLRDGSEIILTTVFPLGEVPLQRRPFWSSEVATAIEAVNDFIRAQQGERVKVYDAYSLLLGEPQKITPAYSRDLLHLNDEGYALLNQHLLPLLAH